MESGRMITIGVKFEITVKKWDRASWFCCLIYLKFSKLVLLIDRTSSMYINERLNAFDSGIMFVFDTFLG